MLDYIFSVFDGKENINNLDKELTLLRDKIIIITKESQELINKLEVSRKLMENMNRLKLTLNVSNELKILIEDHIQSSIDSFKLAKEIEKVGNINDMAKNALEKVINT